MIHTFCSAVDINMIISHLKFIGFGFCLFAFKKEQKVIRLHMFHHLSPLCSFQGAYKSLRLAFLRKKKKGSDIYFVMLV